MTRIRIVSDIHDDLARRHLGVYTLPNDVEADVLVVAGDISGPLSTQGRDWLEMTRQRLGIPIVVVAGNHDFWGGSLHREIPRFRERLQDSDIHLLDGDAVEIAGTRFVGSSLWTDYAVWHNERWTAMHTALRGLNDFRYTRSGTSFPPRKRPYMTPGDLLTEHERHRAAIADHLAVPFAGPTVVVTHHAPSPKSLRMGCVREPLDAAYASDLEDLILAGQPELWIHGHVHERRDFDVDQTRILCNPRGYVQWRSAWGKGIVDREHDGYDERLVVQVTSRPRPVPEGYSVEGGVLVDPHGMPCGPVDRALDEMRAEALANLRVRGDPDEAKAPPSETLRIEPSV